MSFEGVDYLVNVVLCGIESRGELCKLVALLFQECEESLLFFFYVEAAKLRYKTGDERAYLSEILGLDAFESGVG